MITRGLRFVAIVVVLVAALVVPSAGAKPTSRSAKSKPKSTHTKPQNSKSHPKSKPQSKKPTKSKKPKKPKKPKPKAKAPKPTPTPPCADPQVLLLGSYPSEVSANLELEKLDPGQPRTVGGHQFFSGELQGRRVVLAIAGPSPTDTYTTTKIGLTQFGCISAVVFEGTAGGGGASGLADVTVPATWTEYDGQAFANGQTSASVNPQALALAQSLAGEATAQLGDTAAVNDGPCACSGLVTSLKLVPTLRTSRVIVGGSGETDDTGSDDTCSDDGGMLEGCNPCPPSSSSSSAPALVPSDVTAGAKTSGAAARLASLAAADGLLVPDAAELLSDVRPPAPAAAQDPASTQPGTTSGTTFIADDQQTTNSMVAAQQYNVPFIAFRGISDTTAVGDLWPFEWLVYQQLAADNAAVAARLWISHWNGVQSSNVQSPPAA
jgi:nucleoside phosphorylase